MGAHQSYLGTERNAPVVPNWFQPCQCCCRLCYSGEYLRLGTLVSYNRQKLMSIYSNICVSATVCLFVFCHQLGLLGTDLHAVSCGGFVETLNQFC